MRRQQLTRRRDHDRDRKDRHSRLMSQSRSWGRSEHRSRSLSSSGSKSKRISGFDVAPPASAMLAAASTVGEIILELREFLVFCLFVRRQCWATSPTVLTMDVRSDPWDHPSHSWNVSSVSKHFSLPSGQLGALPIKPVQPLTQQATRHARRVYVGGLPTTANEQGKNGVWIKLPIELVNLIEAAIKVKIFFL
ncbi:hypothetical protein F0562_006434 [Nyssa sinensis]|uniref:Uncharacterized protein n=1 Tax=Nyssa sinensis TaxID=561372 RepID=A0A5J5ANQ8_9ASTE|nr:hypothetical protein F0562_006434 [Nyssa sinensis]